VVVSNNTVSTGLTLTLPAGNYVGNIQFIGTIGVPSPSNIVLTSNNNMTVSGTASVFAPTPLYNFGTFSFAAVTSALLFQQENTSLGQLWSANLNVIIGTTTTLTINIQSAGTFGEDLFGGIFTLASHQ